MNIKLLLVNLNTYLILLLFSLLSSGNIIGQNQHFDLPALDTVYDVRIKSIFFYRQHPDKETIPLMFANKNDRLQLHFDFLVGSPSDLYYSVFYFDKDWIESKLSPEEYINGFQEHQIYNTAVSRNTHIPYVQYDLKIEEKEFRYSGNYLVCVYDANRNVLFTRRFYISENNGNASIDFRYPASVEKRSTHQALALEIKLSNIIPANNGQELFVHIMQNGNPQSLEIRSIPNAYINDVFYFNKADDLLFEGLKEYRYKDIRSIISKTRDIEYWDDKDGNFNAWLMPDAIRNDRPYYTDEDLNGKYLVLNRDVSNPELESDYAYMHFSLKTGFPFDEELYLFGAVTDWQLKPEFKMEYDESRRAYTGSFLLKMGYYNYLYALKNENGKAQTDVLEGNWYETENDYNVMVYYRAFGSRFDRLLFAGQFNSNQF